MRTSSFLLALALCISLAGIAIAEEVPFDITSLSLQGTPDGQPPAVEDVCDGETGAAYGLCNAYCEAMDCDSGSPNASAKACDRVAANFARITGDAALPCDCPCVAGVDGWIDALNGPLVHCADVPAGAGEFVGAITPEGSYPGSQTTGFGIGFCGFAFGTGAFLQITDEEADNCNNLIRSKAEAAGLTCVPSFFP